MRASAGIGGLSQLRDGATQRPYAPRTIDALMKTSIAQDAQTAH